MAISRERFEKNDFLARNIDRSKHPIMVFLTKNHKYAFTASEIANSVNLSEYGVRDMLKKLVDSNLVEHKKPYFIAKINNPKKTRKNKKKKKRKDKK